MSGENPLWQAITTSAVLGTQRRPFQPPETNGALGAVLQAVRVEAGLDGERALLRDLAITALHRRSGQLPPAGIQETFPPCPPDDWPRCSPRAGHLLFLILTREYWFLLPEWIDLAAAHQRRVREEHLELLFSAGRRLEQFRVKLSLVVGERGRWLARLNPALQNLCLLPDAQAWQNGQRQERVLYLQSLREHDPEAARALLEAAWEQETPADKAAFLSILSEKLSMVDEPFLETVLDERRKEIRHSAAGLLARLPVSRFAERMSERVLRLVSLKSSLLRSTLEVRLPEGCDEAMQRDGIDPRKTIQVRGGASESTAKVGEKAGWLLQMIALTPSRDWCAAWNRRPVQILELVRKHEWEDVLVEGWKESAARCQDAEWLEALVAYEARRGRQQLVLDLFQLLPSPSKERLVLALLRDHPSLSHDQPAAVYLSACRHSWGEELTQSVTTAICWALQRGDLQPWQWEKLLRDIPCCFHPDLLESAGERIGAALKRKAGGSDVYAEGLVSTLMFRAAMRRAFQTDDPEQEPS